MSKSKKITIIIISVFVGILLLAYISLCLVSAKPGMNGLTVTNGMFRLLTSGKDYIKVGEDCYLYHAETLGKIIENEYEGYTYIDDYIKMYQAENQEIPDLEEFYSGYHNESELLKVSLVIKDGKKLKGHGVQVWQPLTDTYSVYYAPYEE